VIIGYVPLELLDFVVDPKGQRLVGNPDHGGEQMMDMFQTTRNACWECEAPAELKNDGETSLKG
jgi:hypothetical protein